MTLAAVCCGMVLSAALFASRRVRTSTSWPAMATPLASIIGSGFLVLAPLLAATVGAWAPIAMLGVVVIAYAIGATIRFNIRYAEPLLASRDAPRLLVGIERLSRFSLGIAYMISVAFYVRLLASFLLDAFEVQGDFKGRVLTTVVLASIAILGTVRGLHGIEAVEIPAVDVKLIVIAGLLLGMVVFDVLHGSDTITAYRSHPIPNDAVDVARRLAGMLLVVQGFETSRYLGHYYDAETRVRTMRNAQIVSGAIYVGFAALVVTLFDALPGGVHETAILDAARVVTPVLVPLLVIAAIGSQLSAATADTAGGSEMLTNRPRHEHNNHGYAIVCLGAIAIVWATDIFSIVSFASRVFALYYLCQAVVAALTASRVSNRRNRVIIGANIALAAVLLFVVVAAIPGG